MNRRALSLIALFLVPLSLVALPQTLRAAEACTAEEHRQFDFWLGKWTAYSADGKKQGTNHITRLMGACALQENWLAGSFKGTSLNFYNPATKKWYQTWVDNGGGQLRLSGEFNGEYMRMSGTRQSAEGNSVVDRITWTPLADGRIRQYWQSTEDDGKTWQDTFDGYYHRDSE